MSKGFNLSSSYLKTEAEKKYIQLIDELVKADQGPEAEAQPAGKFENIITSIEYNSVYKIVLNRPAKYNAITVKVSGQPLRRL